MKRIRFLGLFVFIALGACSPSQCARNPSASPDDSEVGLDDAMPPAPDVEEDGVSAKCSKACRRLVDADIQCPEGLGFPGGKSCSAVCTENQGTPFAIRVDCIIAAKTVKDVQDCGIRCIKK